MGIGQWEWEGMGILIVFQHTFTTRVTGPLKDQKGAQSRICRYGLVELSSANCFIKRDRRDNSI